MGKTIAPRASFQSTDLQRHARDVLAAARTPEGALIRDKDGTNFWVVPADQVSQDAFTKDALFGVLRLLSLVRLADECRNPALYGDMGWVASLPVDAQVEFAWAYARAVQGIPSTGVGPVEDLIYDWQQTARAWSDGALVEELTAPVPEPLHDVGL